MQWLWQRIWADNKVRCPLHRTRWQIAETDQLGFGFREYQGPPGIWYHPGHKVELNKSWRDKQDARIRKQQAKR